MCLIDGERINPDTKVHRRAVPGEVLELQLGSNGAPEFRCWEKGETVSLADRMQLIIWTLTQDGLKETGITAIFLAPKGRAKGRLVICHGTSATSLMLEKCVSADTLYEVQG